MVVAEASRSFRRFVALLVFMATLGIVPPSQASAGIIEYPCGPNGETFEVMDGIVQFGNTCSGVINIPNDATSIGDGAFDNSGITEINIPNSITSIGDSAFQESLNLTKVNFLPNSTLTLIGNKAFVGTLLSTFEVPGTVEEIGIEAFPSNLIVNGQLTININITSSMNEFKYWFFDCLTTGDCTETGDPFDFNSPADLPQGLIWKAGNLGGGYGTRKLLGGIPTAPYIQTSTYGSLIINWKITSADISPPSYTVNFNANGGSGSMPIETSTVITALSVNTFTRSGYTFAGWATSTSGAVVYADQANYEFASDLNLYAIWTANGPLINLAQIYGSVLLAGGQTLHLEGTDFRSGATVTVEGSDCVVAGHTSSVIECTTPSIASFGTKSVVVTNSDLSFSSIGVLFASSAVSHSVTFFPNGGMGSMNVETSTVTATLTLNAFTRSEYTFSGWATSSNGTVLYQDRASYSFASDLNLYAKWTLNPPPVVFMPPPPQPYLTVGVAPVIRKVENLAVCSSGTYDYGVTYFDGTPNSLSKNVSLMAFQYRFFVDGVENRDLAVSSAAGSISIPMSKLPVSGLLTCQVTVEQGGVSIIAASTLNTAGVGAADALRNREIEKANLIFQSILKANADVKKSALIANRKSWRDSVQLAGTVFTASRTVAKSSKEVVAASKIQSLAVAKAAANYKQGIVLIEGDFLNMNALAENARKESHKNANSVFASVLATNGYGVSLDTNS